MREMPQLSQSPKNDQPSLARALLVTIGLIIFVVSGAIGACSWGLRGLNGMGNPTPEAQRQGVAESDRTTATALVVCLAGATMVVIGAFRLPSRRG